MIARSIQNIQLKDLVSYAIQFAVELLDGRRIGLLEAIAQETCHNRRLAGA